MRRVNSLEECPACCYDEMQCYDDEGTEGEWCPICGHLRMLQYHRPTIEEMAEARRLIKLMKPEDKIAFMHFRVGESLVGRSKHANEKV